MLDRAMVERFAADLSHVFDIGKGPLLLAVSGGPDSVALLLLARQLPGAACRVATVDHGLRPAAAAEAAWVAALCARLGVDHAILRGPLPAQERRTRNVSARARALRYRLLADHAAATGAGAIATAHHADDQVETLLMRLNRGSGLTGLCGVRARSGNVVRPLLGWRRTELAALVEACGIVPRDDPSNRDTRFDRARLRAAIADAAWIDAPAWAHSAQVLGDAEAALAWSVERLWDERVRVSDEGVSLHPAGLPFEFRRRLLACAVAVIDPDAGLRGRAVAAAVGMLDEGGTTMLGAVVCRVARERRDEPVWRLARARQRRSV